MRDGAASERSIITVLSVDMVDSTPHIAASEPEEAQAFFDRWYDHVSAAVERAGGLLVNFGGDGGLAVFGWPSPLEDHADRACAAAWDIQHTDGASPGPDGQPVRLRVGVHSGLVALRRLRREGRARFDTIGATVNIAAKLQQSAPSGGILVSAAAVKLCRSPLEITSLDSPANLSAVNTRAFRLEARPDETVGRDVARRYPSPIVGRRDELARLAKALPRPGGKSASIALIGEAGIGKSRLAAAAIAGAGDARILVFYGDTQKRTTAFAAVRSLIKDLLHLHGSVSVERLQAAVANTSLEAASVAALETLLTRHDVKGQARFDLPTQTQIARALASFCAQALTQPTLILIEDVHLVDLESRQFLRLLARTKSAQPLCLLITGRPEALPDVRETVKTVIRLDPLARPDMEDLGRHLWPDGQPPAGLLNRVVDRAEGVPFVLEELIRSLEGGQASVVALPTTVVSVIHARLQRLSPTAKALAQALSLLGEHADVDFVGAVLHRRSAALAGDLAELERFAFIHPLSGNFAHLRHQMIAEACTDTIPRERRRNLHKTALQAILARNPNLSGRYERLAFHAEGAGLDEAALDYLWEAGLEARRSSAAASLNLIFDRAMELIARIGPAAEGKYVDFVLTVCALMVQLGEFDKMNMYLPRVIELARGGGGPSLVSSSLSQLGMISWFEGRYEEALKATEEGLALARNTNSVALIFSNQLMLANALHDLGRVQEAIAEGRKICEMLTGDLETARLGASGIPKAIALSFLGWNMMDTGDFAEAQACALGALEIADRQQDPYSEVLARSVLGRSLLMLGQNSEAEVCMSAALRLAKQDGYDAIKSDLAGRTATALARMGRSREGVELVEDCLTKGLHLRTGQLELFFLYAGYAEALIRHGRVDDGLGRLKDALAIAQRTGNPCWMAEGLQLRAQLLGLVAPGDPQIKADIAECNAICERYGLAAWRLPNDSAVA